MGTNAMPRVAVPLTALRVKHAKPGRYGDGRGLFLLVRPNGTRFWIFRYRIAGRLREMGLGSAAVFSLADARQRAGDLFRKVKLGTDPLAERDEEKARVRNVVTFARAAEEYFQANAPGWKNAKHRQQWKSTIATYALPIIGEMAVGDIDTPAVLRVLQPIWQDKTETASRLRGRIEAVLDLASSNGWRSGENPARWDGNLKGPLAPRSKLARVKHHAALPWQDVGAFLADLGLQAGVAQMALRFTILTAARSGEAVGATWGEIDLQAKVWTVPAARMKAGAAHQVPLSTDALAVLAEAAALRMDPSPAAPVFPGVKPGKPLSDTALMMVLRRMGRGDLTTHGFRSTFRDWAGEATNTPQEVAEAALAHTRTNKTEAAYARGSMLEKRRALMEAWGAWCARPAPAGVVVPIRGAVA